MFAEADLTLDWHLTVTAISYLFTYFFNHRTSFLSIVVVVVVVVSVVVFSLKLGILTWCEFGFICVSLLVWFVCFESVCVCACVCIVLFHFQCFALSYQELVVNYNFAGAVTNFEQLYSVVVYSLIARNTCYFFALGNGFYNDLVWYEIYSMYEIYSVLLHDKVV